MKPTLLHGFSAQELHELIDEVVALQSGGGPFTEKVGGDICGGPCGGPYHTHHSPWNKSPSANAGDGASAAKQVDVFWGDPSPLRGSYESVSGGPFEANGCTSPIMDDHGIPDSSGGPVCGGPLGANRNHHFRAGGHVQHQAAVPCAAVPLGANRNGATTQ